MKGLEIAKIIGSITASVVGVAGTSTLGTHYSSLETIEDQLNKDVLTQSSKTPEQWIAVQKRLNSLKSTPRSKNFIAVKQSNSEQGEEIKKLCQNISKTTYKSLITSQNPILLKDVREFCIYKIKDDIGTDKLIDLSLNTNTEKKEWEQNLDKLKKHDDKTVKAKLRGKLLTLKNKATADQSNDKEDNWKELRSWCRYAYEITFTGKEKGDWKLVNAYCTKQAQK